MEKNKNNKPEKIAKNKPKKTEKKTPKKHSSVQKKIYKKEKVLTSKLKIIPLGGLEEIGKNMTVFEYENDIIVIDCGMAFPDNDMPGIDLVIPNFSYLEKNKDKIRGIFLTHGHEDHIGALPYVLKEINVPVYGNKLTLGLVKRKLVEHKMEKSAMLIETKPGDVIKRGVFSVEFIKVNHSIPDAAGFAIKTPVGTVVHTGDFKIDTTPIRGRMIDLARLGELGKKGVLLLMSDSTNAQRPGFALSEKKVGHSLDTIFQTADNKRIIVATFASNIHRVQQIINGAVKIGRKVAISGRSMENVVNVALELGYMTMPKGTLIPLSDVSRYPNDKVLIITTGSQGEPMSALNRMAFSDHKTINITSQDLVVISASPIPGNERLVSNVVNELEKLGARVVADSLAEVHVSGHACQEELKLILGLVKPKFFMPVHGEYRHLVSHSELAKECGMTDNDIAIMEIGKVLELDKKSMKINGNVASGKILIDGIGVGDVGNIVLRDRKNLAQDGIIIVTASIDSARKKILSDPEIISRGFVYVRESEDLIEGARNAVKKVLESNASVGNFEWNTIKADIKDSLSAYIYSKTKRRPMVIPVVTDCK